VKFFKIKIPDKNVLIAKVTKLYGVLFNPCCEKQKKPAVIPRPVLLSVKIKN